MQVDGGPDLSQALQSRLQRSPGYRRHKPLSGVRVQHPLREISSPAAVPPSSVTSFLRRSVFYQLASPSTCPISCCCTSLFLRLRSLCYTHMSPLPAPECICMGGHSPCFSRGYCSVLLKKPLGEKFTCSRACGFLPPPLLGHGTFHLVQRG